MSTDIDIFQQANTSVAKHRERDDGFTSSITASSMTSKRISIRGGVFRLMVNGKEINHSDQRHMDVVIVNASPAVHRTFYAGAYNMNAKAAPPVCWSSDSVKPDDTVAEPQGSACATCPQNIKGSGPNGTRACRYSRRIAVVLADQDVNGNYVIGDEVYQITLPSQSIFGSGTADKRPLHEYTDYVRANGENLMSVVTRMSFDTSSATPRLGFKAVSVLSDDDYDKCGTYSVSEEAKRAITLTVSSGDNDGNEEFAKAPTNVPVKERPAPKTAPVFMAKTADQDETDNIPEPTVRSTAKADAKPAPKVEKVDAPDVSLDSLIDDWA